MTIVWDKNIKELTWFVTSNKMDKTIVVSVSTVKVHPLYNKRFTRHKKYYVHDEENSASVWDKVTIRADIPRSKLKRWKLINIVTKVAS